MDKQPTFYHERHGGRTYSEVSMAIEAELVCKVSPLPGHFLRSVLYGSTGRKMV